MNRFVFYLILVNMMTYMVSTTPRLLVKSRETGTIPSLILALIVGMVLTYIIVSQFSHFPGQGLPEILKKYTPKWFSTPVLLIFSLAFFYAGLSTLLVYTFIISRFLLPEMSIYTIVLTFVLTVTYGVYMKTRNILYLSEIIFIVVVPFIVFVQIKGYVSKNMHWDYVRIAVMHINHLPDYLPFATSLFIVIGAANLVIFNRYFINLKKPSRKSMTLLTIICAYILGTTYFLPIGLEGFDSLDNVLYPWITTSDSIRMKFGIIERIVFIFIGAFLALSVVSITIHWHVSIKLLTSVVYFKKFEWKKVNFTMLLFISCYWAFGLYRARTATADSFYKVIEVFDIYFLPVLLALLIGSMMVAKRRASKCRDSKN